MTRRPTSRGDQEQPGRRHPACPYSRVKVDRLRPDSPCNQAQRLWREAQDLASRGLWEQAQTPIAQYVDIMLTNYPGTNDAEDAVWNHADFYRRMLKFDKAFQLAYELRLSDDDRMHMIWDIQDEEALGIHHGCAVQLRCMSPRKTLEVHGQAGVVKGKADGDQYHVAVGAIIRAIHRENMCLIPVAMQVTLAAKSKDTWNVTCLRMSGEVCATFDVMRWELRYLRRLVAKESGHPQSIVQLVLPGGVLVDDGPDGVDALRQHADALVDALHSQGKSLMNDGKTDAQ